MRGARRAEQQRWEQAAFTAWQSAAFARTEKLKPFGEYLKKMRPGKRDLRDLVAEFEAMAANGMAVSVKHSRKG